MTYYLENVAKLYEKVKAKQINKYKIEEALIGDNTPSLVSVMEFENKEALDTVFKSDTYQKLLPYRNKAFSKLEAYIS